MGGGNAPKVGSDAPGSNVLRGMVVLVGGDGPAPPGFGLFLGVERGRGPILCCIFGLRIRFFGRGDGYKRMNDNGGLATGISRQIFADLSVLCTLARLDGVRATVALQEECHDDVAAGVMTKSTANPY